MQRNYKKVTQFFFFFFFKYNWRGSLILSKKNFKMDFPFLLRTDFSLKINFFSVKIRLGRLLIEKFNSAIRELQRDDIVFIYIIIYEYC